MAGESRNRRDGGLIYGPGLSPDEPPIQGSTARIRAAERIGRWRPARPTGTVAPPRRTEPTASLPWPVGGGGVL